jgi:integrase
MVDPAKVMTHGEVRAILKYLHRKKKLSVRARTNLTIFRLSACCGLRGCEIGGLTVGNVWVNSTSRPAIKVAKTTTKGRHNVTRTNPEGKDRRKARMVPLWWDAGTLADIRAHKEFRLSQGATDDDLFVIGLQGQKLKTARLRARWVVIVKKVLGKERAAQLSLHSGRHTFPSHALHSRRSLPEVQIALGHDSLENTTRYVHQFDNPDAVDLFADLSTPVEPPPVVPGPVVTGT